MKNNTWIAGLVIAFLVGGMGGYVIGQKAGKQKGDADGYTRAKADIKKSEELSAEKATTEAAKAANPFQAINPLQGVEANPFEKVKKILNPFQ